MDPDKVVEITVDDGTLTIHAERREEHKEPHRSGFHYGSFTRSVPFPARADTAHIAKGWGMVFQPTLPLRTGWEMPVMGLGTWLLTANTERTVAEAASGAAREAVQVPAPAPVSL
jgi:Hsp20/alpha crystallin family protein